MDSNGVCGALSTSERDCNALGGMFQIIINDLRTGASNWDDLLVKASKLNAQLKATITASTAFLDAFQKIADLATTTRSGTKEIGSAFTRLCLRQRSVEAKLKSMSNAMGDSFILPLQDRVEDWKRIIATIDKEHKQEVKRLKALRKKSSPIESKATLRIKRHPRSKLKSEYRAAGSMFDIARACESPDLGKERYFMLEDVERKFVRRALVEERSQYCLFFDSYRPVIEEELAMIQEVQHLEEVLGQLCDLTSEPYKLPASSESYITKLHYANSVDAIADSETSSIYPRSRKSSISSITSINSLSTDSFSLSNGKSLPNLAPEFRPKSIASQDSGFISNATDYNVPNIGRLTLNAANKKMINEIDSLLSRSKSIEPRSRRMTEYCGDCHTLDGEYASTDQLFALKRQQSEVGSTPPSIYVNYRDERLGSVTPTNDSNSNSTDSSPSGAEFTYRTVRTSPNKPKAPPPPPPVRHSSMLSRSSRPPTPTLPRPSTTKIYVIQDNGHPPDFPPPPPEAYVNYSEPEPLQHSPHHPQQHQQQHHPQTPNNQQQVYAVPNTNTHLVLCNDPNCLQGLHHNASPHPPQRVPSPILYASPTSRQYHTLKSTSPEFQKFRQQMNGFGTLRSKSVARDYTTSAFDLQDHQL